MTTFTSSTFLALTNDVLTELNEVNLTSGTFGSAVGFYAVAQNAVNKSIRDINAVKWEWPFNHAATTQLITPGTPGYALPNDCKTVDWDTFMVEQNLNLTNPQQAAWLPPLDYNRYCQYYRPSDANADTSAWGSPMRVARSSDMKFILTPYPDQAYVVDYEYWKTYTDMVNYNDLSNVPNIFDYVIINGAMKWCYRFRENLEASSAADKDFQDGIKYMRNIYIQDYQKFFDNRADNYTYSSRTW